MRISELSRRTGVAVATIKYYIRAGLLPAGRTTAATQAEYDDRHVRRLRLIRALIAVRGLSVSTTGEVLEALEEETDLHRTLGLALGALRPATEDGTETEGLDDVDSLIREMGWQVHKDSRARTTLAETLSTLRDLGLDFDWRTALPYAALATQTAELDLEQLQDAADPAEMVERAILISILLEPALMALRRMAQENASAKRHGY